MTEALSLFSLVLEKMTFLIIKWARHLLVVGKTTGFFSDFEEFGGRSCRLSIRVLCLISFDFCFPYAVMRLTTCIFSFLQESYLPDIIGWWFTFLRLDSLLYLHLYYHLYLLVWKLVRMHWTFVMCLTSSPELLLSPYKECTILKLPT